jgi:epsilon-lactone hydrolase
MGGLFSRRKRQATEHPSQQIVERYTNEAFLGGSPEALEATVSEDCFVRKTLPLFWSAFADRSGKADVRITSADGQYVAQNFTLNARHVGPWLDFQPTGKQVTLDATAIFRLANDKIVDLWVTWDWLPLQRSLMVSPQAEQVRNQVKNVVGPAYRTILQAPLEIRRTQFEAFMTQTPLPPDVEIEEVEAGGVSCEWVRIAGGAQESSSRAILYLHGGWGVIGSARTERVLSAALARMSGRAVLSVNYRLAPEHPFPAALEDTLAVYRWWLAGGRAPESLILAGFSVGGGLALASLVALRDAGDPLPAGAILLSAVTDWAATGHSHVTNIEHELLSTPAIVSEMRANYLGECEPRTPLASPLFADLHGLPPLLIQVGSDELLRDDSTQVAEDARAAGVAVTLHIGEGMWHGWHLTAARLPFPEGQAALDQISDFVTRLS